MSENGSCLKAYSRRGGSVRDIVLQSILLYDRLHFNFFISRLPAIFLASSESNLLKVSAIKSLSVLLMEINECSVVISVAGHWTLCLFSFVAIRFAVG